MNAVTVNSSYAINRGDVAGKIRVGKADLFYGMHYTPYHYGVSHVNTIVEHGHYLKKNAKFIDREVTKWSEMIKDWEEGVEIFGLCLN